MLHCMLKHHYPWHAANHCSYPIHYYLFRRRGAETPFLPTKIALHQALMVSLAKCSNPPQTQNLTCSAPYLTTLWLKWRSLRAGRPPTLHRFPRVVIHLWHSTTAHKVLERIIYSRISSFLIRTSSYPTPRSSTQEALLSVTNSWHQLLAKIQQVAAVCLFFRCKNSINFDSVPHHQLIATLEKTGIRSPLLNWICDYLTDREQRVVLDGTISDPTPVTSGVPQGSILRPLLFNIFMNSISELPIS